MNRWGRPLSALLVVALAAVSTEARAQDLPWIGVFVVDDVGLSERDFRDILEGIEAIVVDFGGLELVPFDDIARELTRRELQDLDRCGTDPVCYADLVPRSLLDVALVMTISESPDGFDADLTSVNLHGPTIDGGSYGAFPAADQTLFILVPIYEALEPLADIRVDHGSSTRRDPPPPDPDPVATNPYEPPPADNTPSWMPASLLDDEDGDGNTLATTMIVGGALLTAGGLLLWVSADDAQRDIQARPHSRAELLTLQDSAESNASLGNILFGAGLVTLAAGIIFEEAGIGADGGDFDDSFFDDDDGWSNIRISPTVTGNGVGIWVGF
jgi:hypothetical protein